MGRRHEGRPVAEKYSVSPRVVHRLAAAAARDGEIGPTPADAVGVRWPGGPGSAVHALIAARPDRTLVELQERLRRRRVWRPIWRRSAAWGSPSKKNRTRAEQQRADVVVARQVWADTCCPSTARDLCFSMRAASRRT